jgi:uncharacterized repeat protein (TIGR03803 family)
VLANTFRRTLVALIASCTAATAQAPTTVYQFTGLEDGSMPSGGLVRVGDILYGTTSSADSGGTGTVFRIAGDTLTTLHRFDGIQDGGSVASVTAHNGVLYGTTQSSQRCKGSVFRLDLASGDESTLYCFRGDRDGALPLAGLLYRNGRLYGTTSRGGSADKGTVFVVDAVTGRHRVLYSFSGGADGATPAADLILVDGALYGTTAEGGTFNGACASGGNDPGCGTVFKLDPRTRDLTVIHRFSRLGDGGTPSAGLLAVSGTLYGTTRFGGRDDFGAAFTIDLASGAERVIHDFSNNDNGGGLYPVAPLIWHHGALYGTTLEGGLCGCGIVFRMDPDTGELTTLTDFLDPTIGFYPAAPVVYRGGYVYGVTQFGGDFDGACSVDGLDPGCGIVFKVPAGTNRAARPSPR